MANYNFLGDISTITNKILIVVKWKFLFGLFNSYNLTSYQTQFAKPDIYQDKSTKPYLYIGDLSKSIELSLPNQIHKIHEKAYKERSRGVCVCVCVCVCVWFVQCFYATLWVVCNAILFYDMWCNVRKCHDMTHWLVADKLPCFALKLKTLVHFLVHVKSHIEKWTKG